MTDKTKAMAAFEQEAEMGDILGFSRDGGFSRYFRNKYDIAQVEWWEALDYFAEQGNLEFTGQTDSTGPVYNFRTKGAKKNEK